MSLLFKSLRRFSLDFSNLSSSITTEANRNYSVDTSSQPIPGYLTANHSASHAVIMIHEWWGFNKSMAKTADYFSNNDIKVFVPDLYRGAPAIDA